MALLFTFVFFFFFFFFNDTATTEIYTLSLHDALPIFAHGGELFIEEVLADARAFAGRDAQARPTITGVGPLDRKSTRLNSSHVEISYAVFCLKKKKNIKRHHYNNKKTRTLL